MSACRRNFRCRASSACGGGEPLADPAQPGKSEEWRGRASSKPLAPSIPALRRAVPLTPSLRDGGGEARYPYVADLSDPSFPATPPLHLLDAPAASSEWPAYASRPYPITQRFGSERPVLDVLYLAGGVAALLLFALYAVLLKKA